MRSIILGTIHHHVTGVSKAGRMRWAKEAISAGKMKTAYKI
jgi:hypothetical protein